MVPVNWVFSATMKAEAAIRECAARGHRGSAVGRHSAGMTLTEVLVAIGILALVFGGCYRLITQVTQMRVAAQRRYAAVVIANNRIERIKAAGFREAFAYVENRVPVDERGTPASDGRFLRTTVVEPGVAGDSRLARVVVTVEQRPLRAGVPVGQPESVATLLTEYLVP